MKRFLICLCLEAPVVSTPLLGQAQTTGRINGRALDEQNDPIAGAWVTPVSSVLQGKRVTETDEKGEFLAALLPVGPYAVSVATRGKQTVSSPGAAPPRFATAIPAASTSHA